MTLYHVVWGIDLDAESPQEAARKTLEIQRDPASLATFFDVTDSETGEATGIELVEGNA